MAPQEIPDQLIVVRCAKHGIGKIVVDRPAGVTAARSSSGSSSRIWSVRRRPKGIPRRASSSTGWTGPCRIPVELRGDLALTRIADW